MNINEAIEATAKKQKECRRAFVKYLFLGVLFIVILPVGGGFAVGHFLKIALHRYFSSLSTYLHPVFLVTPKTKSAERITASNLILAKL